MYQYLSFPFPSPSFTPFLSSLSPSQEHRLKRNTGYDQYIKFFITQTLQCGVLPGPRWTPSLMPWSTICLDHGVPSAVSHSFCFSCLCGFFFFTLFLLFLTFLKYVFPVWPRDSLLGPLELILMHGNPIFFSRDGRPAEVSFGMC